MADNQDYIVKAEVEQKLEKMFNNKKYSDTVFLVNNTQFHAISYLVTVSSDVLETLLENHFEICNDREITIGGIKDEKSFFVILQYLYGMEINLAEMSKTVVCEVLRLSDTYKITDLCNAIKCFLSNLDCFQLDSLVVLMNTAKKFSLIDLYQKLSIAAYNITEQLVKHPSFSNMQYDVLCDLIRSDWFCALEIDILTGVLTWHSENLSDGPNIAKGLPLVKMDSGNIVEDQNDTIDSQSEGTCDATQTETNVSQTVLSHVGENSVFEDSAMCSGNSDVNMIDSYIVPDRPDSCIELMANFSKNVLKKLMSHIRLKQISASELIDALATDLFMTYRYIFSDSKFFFQSSEPRRKYIFSPAMVRVRNTTAFSNAQIKSNTSESTSDETSFANTPATNFQITIWTSYVEEYLYDITKKFTINSKLDVNVLYESEEQYLIGNINWKVCMKVFNSSTRFQKFLVYLKCTSDKNDWECTTNCQVQMFPRTKDFPTDYRSFKLTPNNSCESIRNKYFISDTTLGEEYGKESFKSFGVYTFDVHFESIHCKVK